MKPGRGCALRPSSKIGESNSAAVILEAVQWNYRTASKSECREVLLINCEAVGEIGF